MNQIISILRKDLRYLWPEITASLILTALFAYCEPQSWPWSPAPGNETEIAILLAALLGVSWSLLIIRLVQAERLVGLNQFWTTRPYEWTKLVAAKVLFVLLAMYLPLVLSQLCLLHLARLPIFASIPLLLLNLLVLTAVITLPLAAIAALTASFAQAVMASLGTMVAAIAVAASGVLFGPSFTPLYLLPVLASIEIVILSALLLNQYRRRVTRDNLALAALLVAALALTQVLVVGRRLATLGFDPPSPANALSIRFDLDPLRASESALPTDSGDPVPLKFPLTLSPLDGATTFTIEARRITLTSPDGYLWQSRWEKADVFVSSQGAHADARVEIPRAAYDRLAGHPTSVSIDFATAELRDQPSVTVPLSTSGSETPGIGYCYLQEGYGSVRCRSAFRQPGYFAVSTFGNEGLGGACAAPAAQQVPAHGSIGDVERSPLMLHFSPVLEFPLRLVRAEAGSTLCPGTPITFTPRRLVRRLLVPMLPSAPVTLSKYVD